MKELYKILLVTQLILSHYFISSFSSLSPPQNDISSVQFSRSDVSNCLRPHELQQARPPCPSPAPGVYPTHVH